MKLQKLKEQLAEMEQYVDEKEQRNSAVSKAPVRWHLAHSLKVIHSILSALEISNPDQYKKSFSLKKELVYFTGKIPRGKAKAPKTVVPEENISEAELREQIVLAGQKIKGIKKLPKKAFFEHPYFGHIKRDETAKFLVIHTEHHLKIIRDIVGSVKA